MTNEQEMLTIIYFIFVDLPYIMAALRRLLFAEIARSPEPQIGM